MDSYEYLLLITIIYFSIESNYSKEKEKLFANIGRIFKRIIDNFQRNIY